MPRVLMTDKHPDKYNANGFLDYSEGWNKWLVINMEKETHSPKVWEMVYPVKHLPCRPVDLNSDPHHQHKSQVRQCTSVTSALGGQVGRRAGVGDRMVSGDHSQLASLDRWVPGSGSGSVSNNKVERVMEEDTMSVSSTHSHEYPHKHFSTHTEREI